MASWGVTEALTGVHAGALGPDGRAGEQPRATTVRRNLVHEIGLWQKQSSMWFQAVTHQELIAIDLCEITTHFTVPFVFV